MGSTEDSRNEIMRKVYEEGVEEGLKLGTDAKVLDVARNFRREGLSDEVIATCTGLDISDIRSMR